MIIQMKQAKGYRVLISGGGTGGHIFPAIAIADGIRAIDSTAEILFVGANGRMEMEKVPAAGYKIEGLNIAGIQRKLTLKNLAVPFKLAGSLLKASSIINKFKPQVVVGVGGYASGPTLKMAGLKGLPTLIQEQNSYPGITNKLLASKAAKICVAYEGMERFFDVSLIELTGNPVRQAIVDMQIDRFEACRAMGLNPEKKTILIVGGSLGARTINNSALKNLSTIYNRTDVQLLWQSGKLYFDRCAEQIEEEKNVHLHAFLTEMDKAYAAADLIIARAGALTISELCLIGKPVILVPSPNVSEDHQTHNAMALVRKDAALMVKDADAEQDLFSKALSLLDDQEQMNLLAANILSMAKPDATAQIVKHVLALAEKFKTEAA